MTTFIFLPVFATIWLSINYHKLNTKMKGCDITVASLEAMWLVLIPKFGYNIMAMVIVFK